MLLILVGEARSGKDTVGGFITKNFNAATVAQADPMKRFAAKLCGFSEETLWGASSERDKLVRESRSVEDFWNQAQKNFDEAATLLLSEVLPDFNMAKTEKALARLKSWFHDLHLWDDEISARILLQTVGTEWGRTVQPRMWNAWALRAARSLMEGGVVYDRTRGLVSDRHSGYEHVVITDGRFRNEVLGTKLANGKATLVTNPSAFGKNVGVEGHRSEVEQKSIPQSWFDAQIVNDKDAGLDALERATRTLMQRLMPFTTNIVLR